MKPSRGTGLPAADSAGTIASRKGSAMLTPAPRRNVRLESDFLLMNIRPPGEISKLGERGLNCSGAAYSPPCEGGESAPSKKSFRSENGADGVVAHKLRCV